MQRLLITALACFISVSSFGQNELINNNNKKDNIIGDQINPKNYYKNRRVINTTLKKEDFIVLIKNFKMSCLEILVQHFYCDIYFNSNENTLTSYDGTKYNLKKKFPVEITEECMSLISNMRMGSKEYSKFLIIK
tara:strand:+ start:471 stop:875 length:405 start_codon:yes stop_codon:yes gene_type:complete